jgi:SnoaL-like domain
MKKTITILLMYFFFFGYIEHSKGQDLTKLQKSKIEKQVDSVFHSMIKAAENLEYDKLSQGVDDKNHAGFIAGDSYYANYDSLINFVKTRSQGALSQIIQLREEKITVLSESIVIVTASGNAKIELKNGNEFDNRFYWTFVYNRIGGKWKVIQSHQSSFR